MANIQKNTINEINILHGELIGLYKQSVNKAIQIGERLVKVKKSLPHGEFTSWMKRNVSFSARTGRNYIKLFDNKDKALKAGSISDAYRLIDSKTETVSDIEAIKNHLYSIGINTLIPEKGDEITLYSYDQKDENMKSGFDVLSMKWSDVDGYMNPSIYRIDGEYAYELFNKRGGIKIDSTEDAINLYKDKFNFLAVTNTPEHLGNNLFEGF